jgi:hypothetical protein
MTHDERMAKIRAARVISLAQLEVTMGEMTAREKAIYHIGFNQGAISMAGEVVEQIESEDKA